MMMPPRHIPPMRVVIQQNNQATSLIESGYYQEAIEYLLSALNTLKYHKSSANRYDERLTEQLMNEISLATRLNEMKVFTKLNTKAEDDKSGATQSRFFLFNHAFRLPSSQMAVDPTNEDVISSIVIFNSALAFQLSVAEHPENVDGDDEHLQKAKMLYQLSLLLSTQSQSNRSKDLNFMHLLPLAIVNNMGLVHYQLGDHNTMKQFFVLLLSMEMILASGGTDLGKTSYHGFVRNASTIFVGNTDNADASVR